MTDPINSRVFRVVHLPHRRRDVVSAEDNTPTNVRPGELIVDEESKKLYLGLDDNTAVDIVSATGVTSVTDGITGATRITNCVAISQANYDALPTKDSATLYIITG
jgi:hypothetical protein